jgi:hypothetical protein
LYDHSTDEEVAVEDGGMPAYVRRLLATVKDYPDDMPLRLRTVGMLIARGYPAEAIAQCVAVLERDAGNAEALVLLSQASGGPTAAR